MTKISHAAILLALALSDCSLAATAPVTFLRCDVEHLISKKKTDFSIVLNERDALADVYGFRFPVVKFSPGRIEGEVRKPDVLYAGILQVTKFSVDRITGQVVYTQMAEIEGDAPASQAQIDGLNRRYDSSVVLTGKCEKAAARF